MDIEIAKVYFAQINDYAQAGAKLIQELDKYSQDIFKGAFTFTPPERAGAKFKLYGVQFICGLRSE